MYSTLKETQEAIQNGVSVHAIAQYFLNQIDENADLNAFLEVFKEEVLSEAQRVDANIANGTQGKLAGMVIGIKDNICYANHKVSASSKSLRDSSRGVFPLFINSRIFSRRSKAFS